MKVCWFGIYTNKYPRNKILISGLVSNGVDVTECNVNWKDRNKYFSLIIKFLKLKGNFDLVYCAYPGSVAVILAKILTRKTVVLDAFYSMFDTVVNDRKEIKWYNPKALKLMLIDWLSVMFADVVITDTNAHRIYWSKWLFLNNKKMQTVYLGADNSTYYPIKSENKDSNFVVHFHGNYIPLQGVEKIVEAAKILKEDRSIHFRFIGSGGEQLKIDDFIKTNNLQNIETLGRVSPIVLNEYLNKANIVLGIFGDTAKAKRVIPNKVYEGMAVRKPVITMDTEAIREIFDENDLILISNSPKEIANAILKLRNDIDLKHNISTNGYKKVMSNFSPKPLGAILLNCFNQLLDVR